MKAISCAILNVFVGIFCESTMASKELEKVGTEKAEMKIRRNHQILSMHKASGSTYVISKKKIIMNYSGPKKLCTKLKSSGDRNRVPG